MSKTYDPKMHSAEHLLNQTMVRLLGCERCFSAHINKKKSKCDYHFDRALTGEEIDQIQSMVNDAIGQDLQVTIEQLPIEEAARVFKIERVPQKEDLESLRIVRIGEYDACPCIGPHVASTREIGRFKITSSDFKDEVLRIRFKLV